MSRQDKEKEPEQSVSGSIVYDMPLGDEEVLNSPLPVTPLSVHPPPSVDNPQGKLIDNTQDTFKDVKPPSNESQQQASCTMSNISSAEGDSTRRDGARKDASGDSKRCRSRVSPLISGPFDMGPAGQHALQMKKQQAKKSVQKMLNSQTESSSKKE